MEHIECYKASDGKEFSSSWECAEYELGTIYKDVKFFDSETNVLNIVEDDIEHDDIRFIYIPEDMSEWDFDNLVDFLGEVYCIQIAEKGWNYFDREWGYFRPFSEILNIADKCKQLLEKNKNKG